MKQIAVFGYNRLSFEAISRLDKEFYGIVVIDHDPAKRVGAGKRLRDRQYRFSQRRRSAVGRHRRAYRYLVLFFRYRFGKRVLDAVGAGAGPESEHRRHRR